MYTRRTLAEKLQNPSEIFSFLSEMNVIHKRASVICAEGVWFWPSTTEKMVWFGHVGVISAKKQKIYTIFEFFEQDKASAPEILYIIYEWTQKTSLKRIKKEYCVGYKAINSAISQLGEWWPRRMSRSGIVKGQWRWMGRVCRRGSSTKAGG